VLTTHNCTIITEITQAVTNERITYMLLSRLNTLFKSDKSRHPLLSVEFMSTFVVICVSPINTACRFYAPVSVGFETKQS